MPTYPTNANDPSLTVNNVTDFLINADIVGTNGDVLLTNPTQTLDDLNAMCTNYLTQQLAYYNALHAGGLMQLEETVFTHLAQLKLKRYKTFALRFARLLKELTADVVTAAAITSTAPNVTSQYPSGQNDF